MLCAVRSTVPSMLDTQATKHPKAKDENFEVLATNYADRRRRKLAEAMFIRDEKSSLKVQRDSYKLVLFN